MIVAAGACGDSVVGSGDDSIADADGSIVGACDGSVIGAGAGLIVIVAACETVRLPVVGTGVGDDCCCMYLLAVGTCDGSVAGDGSIFGADALIVGICDGLVIGSGNGSIMIVAVCDYWPLVHVTVWLLVQVMAQLLV